MSAYSRPQLVRTRPGVEALEARATPALIASQLVMIPGSPVGSFMYPATDATLEAGEVDQLLRRAAAASDTEDGIIAIVDRGGNLLGVRVEAGVDPAITSDPEKLAFAIDGAIALARTGAFFGNNQAPLTSRTINNLSQTTMTSREINSDPNVLDPFVRGPGFVAAVTAGAHFPPGIANTPQVDLFAIEHTNRDTTIVPGPDGVIDAGDPTRDNRFNVPSAFIPNSIPPRNQLNPPDSYGFLSGTFPDAQPRGIGTLPGGIPVVKDGTIAGGLGVFFPGQTGFASEENARSVVNNLFEPGQPDRSLEAEFIAFAALGGAPDSGFSFGALGGVPPVEGVTLPFGRIDLVGITLDVFGPGGIQGPRNLFEYGKSLNQGDPDSGANVVIEGGAHPELPPPIPATNTRAGVTVPSGWLVTPHDSAQPGGLTAEDVTRMIQQAVAQAEVTRAAIRLPPGTRTKMVIAVSDTDGDVLGLYRMPDATIFSIDVAVAKSRNVAYYADPTALQPIDQIDGIPAGTAFTNRTFRHVSNPRFPMGIDGKPPAPFSILTDYAPGEIDPNTLIDLVPKPISDFFESVQGHDAFFPQTNFHDPDNLANQNGIVFFPGSAPLYKDGKLVGGLGVSGDGVDQDDVVTFAGSIGFGVPDALLRADEVFVGDIRLPYQKFNRQPLAP